MGDAEALGDQPRADLHVLVDDDVRPPAAARERLEQVRRHRPRDRAGKARAGHLHSASAAGQPGHRWVVAGRVERGRADGECLEPGAGHDRERGSLRPRSGHHGRARGPPEPAGAGAGGGRRRGTVETSRRMRGVCLPGTGPVTPATLATIAGEALHSISDEITRICEAAPCRTHGHPPAELPRDRRRVLLHEGRVRRAPHGPARSPLRDRSGQPGRHRRRGGPAPGVPGAARGEPARRRAGHQHARCPWGLRARAGAGGHRHERGPACAGRPHRPDDLCQRRSGARHHLRSLQPLHRQRAVGPGPGRHHRRTRLDDPGRPGPAAARRPRPTHDPTIPTPDLEGALRS